MSPIRVVVADDSPLIRQILVDMLRREDDIDVVGYARDGEEALARVAELKPDVLVLDMDMPRLDGLGCLRELGPVPTVVVSMGTPAGIETTLEALSLGASDFVCKPESGSLTTLRGIRDEFVAKVREARYAQPSAHRRPVVRASAAGDRPVLITGSAGAARSLEMVLDGFPAPFAAPVVVSLPLPSAYLGPLAQRLSDLGGLPVVEAHPGDRPEAGVVYLGSGLFFDASGSLELAKATADEFLASCPYSDAVVGLLSGANADGAHGAMALRRRGATVYAESEETALHPTLPQAAMANGAVEASFAVELLGAALGEASVRLRKAA